MMHALMGLLLAIACVACERSDAGAAARPAPSSGAAAPPSDPLPEAPPAKPTADTPGSALGSLPDGVGIAPGKKAPEVSVRDAAGEAVQLGDLYARGPVLLVFYRGGWCPYCNFQVRSLAKSRDRLRERNVLPVVVSVDEVDPAARTKATYAIDFPVLSDPDLVAHRAFRVVHEASDVEYLKLKGYGMDLEKHSGRKHHAIAVPSVFLIDPGGTVRWAHADPDYKVRPSIEQLIRVLDELSE